MSQQSAVLCWNTCGGKKLKSVGVETFWLRFVALQVGGSDWPDCITSVLWDLCATRNIWYNFIFFFFHSCTVQHLDTIKVFIYQLQHKSCFKRILKFALKQLLHVSVQSPSSGSVLFELAKVIVLRLWVRIPPGAWIFVCCECCVLSGRGLCDGLITRSEESYRMWRVVVCDQETS